MKLYYVYILANKKNGPIYIGVTNDLIERVHAHKNNLIEGFTQKYHIHDLVYYEAFEDIHEALLREKRMKKWKRKWKIELIEQDNLEWKDLYDHIV
jgi:putative endonuclease